MIFPRTRKTWFKLMWRCNYAGRVMEVRRVPFAVAWRQANEAWELYGGAVHPRDLADKRMRMYKK